MADFEYVSQGDATPLSSGPKPPLSFKHHYSRVTAARAESSTKAFYKYFMIPGIGNLAGGKSANASRTSTMIKLMALRRTSKCCIIPLRDTRSSNRTARALCPNSE